MLERMRHCATVRFNSGRGRKTCRRVLEYENREAKSNCFHACVHLCMCVHIFRWKRGCRKKGFTEDDKIIETPICGTTKIQD